MSYPKIYFRHPDGRSATLRGIKSFDGVRAEGMFTALIDGKPVEQEWTVERADILVMNTEAANRFGSHGVKVMGEGYRADEKLAAFAKDPK